MGIIDDVLIIAGFDQNTSLPAVALTTTDPDAREWADELYRRYKAEADAVDESSA